MKFFFTLIAVFQCIISCSLAAVVRFSNKNNKCVYIKYCVFTYYIHIKEAACRQTSACGHLL